MVVSIQVVVAELGRLGVKVWLLRHIVADTEMDNTGVGSTSDLDIDHRNPVHDSLSDR